ncbi:MAG: hypothetical protein NZM12_06790 [Steroidobacteraceae bacterium]|nr:hypothetical protein [Steroidobacteraceae bacterium]
MMDAISIGAAIALGIVAFFLVLSLGLIVIGTVLRWFARPRM